MQGFEWSCRDSNPGPDKEAVVLSTCVSMLEFSRRRRRTSGRCASLRGSWVSLRHHHSAKASSYLRRSELPGVRAGPGGTMALPNSKLGSHGVRIVASCCSIDFFTGELPSTPGTLTRDLRKLSIPVSPGFWFLSKERFSAWLTSGPRRYAGNGERRPRPEGFYYGLSFRAQAGI